jgi:hypothetical protein
MDNDLHLLAESENKRGHSDTIPGKHDVSVGELMQCSKLPRDAMQGMEGKMGIPRLAHIKKLLVFSSAALWLPEA